jgi:hypothetical protein
LDAAADMRTNRHLNFFLGLLIAVAESCSGVASNEAPGGAAAKAQILPGGRMSTEADDAGVTGYWEGTSTSRCVQIMSEQMGRCSAVEKIDFTFVQQGSAITGFFRCEGGYQGCLGDTGKIYHGELNASGVAMRVMMEGGASCMFTGRRSAEAIDGGYSCYEGGGLVEQGQWQARRQY